MAMTVTIKGLDSFIAALAKIPDIAKKNMRVAIKEGLQEVEELASTDHKYKSHTGHADQAYKPTVAGNGMSGTLQLDGKVSNAPYVFSLHEGHKAYKVKPVHKKALYWTKGGGEFFSKGHNVPAASGDPFLYRAFERKESRLVEIMQAAMGKTIKEAGF
jgi:hypothetical protein